MFLVILLPHLSWCPKPSKRLLLISFWSLRMGSRRRIMYVPVSVGEYASEHFQTRCCIFVRLYIGKRRCYCSFLPFSTLYRIHYCIHSLLLYNGLRIVAMTNLDAAIYTVWTSLWISFLRWPISSRLWSQPYSRLSCYIRSWMATNGWAFFSWFRVWVWFNMIQNNTFIMKIQYVRIAVILRNRNHYWDSFVWYSVPSLLALQACTLKRS